MSKKPSAPKRKPKYGSVSSFRWIMGRIWKTNKFIAVSAVSVIPLAIILYAFGLYFPPVMLGLFEDGRDFSTIVLVIGGLLASQLVFRLAKNVVDTKREVMERLSSFILRYEYTEKLFDLDRYLLLDPEIQKKQNRAGNAVWGSGNRYPIILANMSVDILCFFLFGTVIASLNAFIIILLIAGSLINYFVQRYKSRRDYQDAENRDLNEKKLGYVSFEVSRDMKYGKDIRLFGLAPFLAAKVKTLIKEHTYYLNKTQLTQTAVTVTSSFVALVRDGVAYFLLISKALAGELSIAEFSLYFAAISQLSNFFSGILGAWTLMRDGALQISDYREFLDIEGRLFRGEGVSAPAGKPLSIEFKNVSYKYPEGDKQALKNISFKIEAGEKAALVGLNGAGKTTLTMLCCGLLIPDEGEVLINGHSVFEYDRGVLYSLFSLVPQNYNLMPSSIAENITVAPEGERDMSRLMECVAAAGLDKKISSLEKGLETPLNKRFNPDGIELSGGEKQKLLLARALYRASPILILDEPTAALDPIAEDEMYRKYSENTNNCTSVFISHRLASTRFCDKIYLLDGMTLAERGTHGELMALGGKYFELFNVQSEYYK
ncbi:MAG: ABC transporter ATP-binding protein [Eubacteriales bacterium]